jgi:DNA repair exonuclease SbcCD nuclease subunit
VAHGLFEPFDYADWDTERLLDESTVDFDAVLLGDNHKPQKAQIDDTWVTYCGSTERASADEREDRGYNIVEFDERVSIRRRGLATREFVFVEVELGESEGVERVRERVGQHDLEDAVVVVHIEGEGEPVAPASIEEFADEEGALVARVTDHREVADSAEIDVNFADPDDAVEERIREMGLSRAARDIDETVRASKTADSNVTDEVERRVQAILDDADPDAFQPATDDSPDDEAGETTVTAERATTEEPTKTDGGDADDGESTAVGTDADTNGDGDRNGQPSLGDFE